MGVCKELSLDSDMTQCLMEVTEKEAVEQMAELKKACKYLKSWTLGDWKVEEKFQLDIEAYANKKGITLENLHSPRNKDVVVFK